MEGARYLHAARLLANHDISKTTLQGDETHTGFLKLLEYKQKLLKRFIHVEHPKHGFLENERATSARTLLTISRTRTRLPLQADLSWVGSMAPSSVEALQFIEDGHVAIGPGTCHMAGTGCKQHGHTQVQPPSTPARMHA